jgi:hypothetical protein
LKIPDKETFSKLTIKKTLAAMFLLSYIPFAPSVIARPAKTGPGCQQ